MGRKLLAAVLASAAVCTWGCKSSDQGGGAGGGGGEAKPAYECSITEREACHALAVRTRAARMDLGQATGKAFGLIMQRMMVLGQMPAGPPFSAYYNCDENDLDVEFCFPVAKAAKGAGEVKAIEVPAMRGASCVFTGHYSGVGAAYAALDDWILKNGHRRKGPVYEFYLNDPAKTKPEDLKTIVFIPIE